MRVFTVAMGKIEALGHFPEDLKIGVLYFDSSGQNLNQRMKLGGFVLQGMSSNGFRAFPLAITDQTDLELGLNGRDLLSGAELVIFIVNCGQNSSFSGQFCKGKSIRELGSKTQVHTYFSRLAGRIVQRGMQCACFLDE